MSAFDPKAAGNMESRGSVIVTGASRGLGLLVAEFLGRQGYTPVIDARDGGSLRSAAAAIPGATVVAGDIADSLHRRDLIAAAQRAGPLRALVNNASTLGLSPMPSLSGYPVDALRRVFEVNVFAPLALIQDALPSLRAGRGLIVNVTSDAANAGYPHWGGYGASKAALELLTRTLAAEIDDVGVVAVDPGDMRTQMHQEAFPGEDISDRPEPKVTLPFWAWLFAQDPLAISGERLQAQADVWKVPA